MSIRTSDMMPMLGRMGVGGLCLPAGCLLTQWGWNRLSLCCWRVNFTPPRGRPLYWTMLFISTWCTKCDCEQLVSNRGRWGLLLPEEVGGVKEDMNFPLTATEALELVELQSLSVLKMHWSIHSECNLLGGEVFFFFYFCNNNDDNNEFFECSFTIEPKAYINNKKKKAKFHTPKTHMKHTQTSH